MTFRHLRLHRLGAVVLAALFNKLFHFYKSYSLELVKTNRDHCLCVKYTPDGCRVLSMSISMLFSVNFDVQY